MKKLNYSILTAILLGILFNINLFAQKDVPPATQDFGIKFSGFVKTDFAFDTRQSATIREDHFLLYPKKELLDANGDDINGVPSLNILSIQTRLTGKITAPDFLGAKTSGIIEGAFFGSAEGNINTFRLRHAFLKLEWENTHLMVGQFWHPMFIEDNFPGVVSFNTGVPFQPFSRNPQIRLTQKLGFMDIILAACSQRDFQSFAPIMDAGKEISGNTSEASRDAVVPDLNATFKFKAGTHLFGFGGEYKMLKPRTSFLGVKTDNMVNSYAAMAFAKLVFGDFSVKLEGIYGQNLANMTMLSGYWVKAVDSVAKTEEYTPSNLLSAWGELSYGKDVEISIFGGYTKNMGAAEDIISGGTFFGRGSDIESVLRVAPRVIWTVGKVKFACEIEYTQAAYGAIDKTDKMKVIDTKSVSNIRALLAGYLFF